MTIKNFVEWGDYVLLKLSDGSVQVYQQGVGTLTLVREVDGRLVASPQTALPSPVVDVVVGMFFAV